MQLRKLLSIRKKRTEIRFGEPLFWCHSGTAYCGVHTACCSNVYSYSTLTTNAAAVSNFNHDVNLFPVMAYWLPSLIPSSIIFWRLLLGFWWYAFSRQSQKGEQVGAQKSGRAQRTSMAMLLFISHPHEFPYCDEAPKKPVFFLLDSICRIITSPEMNFCPLGCGWLWRQIWDRIPWKLRILNYRQVSDARSITHQEASSCLIGWMDTVIFSVYF